MIQSQAIATCFLTTESGLPTQKGAKMCKEPVLDLLWGKPWRSIAELQYDKLVTARTNFSAQARQHVKHFLRVVENVLAVNSLLSLSDSYSPI